MENELVQSLRPAADVFRRLQIPYAIGGSVASSVYGMPRSTLDIALVADIRADRVSDLCGQLKPIYYVDEDAVREAVATRASFNLVHLQTMIKVDVFILKAAAYDREAFQRVRSDTLSEEPDAERFFLMSPEDVILNKLLWFRMGHEISDRQWQDVLGVIRVQQSNLDRAYVQRWAKALSVDDLAQRAWREADRGK